MRCSVLLFLLAPCLALAAAQELYFTEWRFRQAVEKALQSIETILETTRQPVLAEYEADHTYQDKYALVEFVTNSAIGSFVNVLQLLGMDQHEEHLETPLAWVHSQNQGVSLRFQATRTCELEKETERQVTVKETEIERSRGGAGLMGRATTDTETVKVKQTRKEYHWRVQGTYKLLLQSGDETLELSNRELSTLIVTSAGGAPKEHVPKEHVPTPPRPPISAKSVTQDVSLTWLLQMISPQTDHVVCQFSIDRFAATCKTPSRNPEITKALAFREQFVNWAQVVHDFLTNDIELAVHRHATEPVTRRLSDLNFVSELFVPIVPLMENSTVLDTADMDQFLRLQKATLESAMASLSKLYGNSKFIGKDEANLVLLTKHLIHLSERFHESVAYVEHMLKTQLVQAIGKQVTAPDFANFMSFHAQKLFAPAYAPRPFSYAIRRPDHYPDGMLSMERQFWSNDNNKKKEPIETLVRTIPGDDPSSPSPPIFMPVNAATKIEIRGHRYVHGWMQHVWQHSSERHYLVARAHQYSSFMLVVGVMGGPDTFLPKDAIILQNKDELLIPLLTNVLPSAKEFKDAIASLSPEQKTFAQAFRSMQLESSVFGVCVIQLKPQLEMLLRLPNGALTKQIQLTQDLMSLFVEYQIPSDLLSFDGAEEASVTEKVDAVKRDVAAVMEVIHKEKAKQLQEEKNKEEMRKAKFAAAAADGAPTSRSPNGSPTSGSFTTSYSASSSPKRKLMNMDADGPSLLMMDELMMDEPMMAAGMPESAQQSTGSATPTPPKATRETPKKDGKQRPVIQAVSNDFTLIPKILDAELEEHDKDGSLRSTIVKAGPDWERRRQENLLLPMSETYLVSQEIESEKHKAFDLLTALSRSGSLAIEHSELHIIIAVSHCFENDIMSTIIRENVNPIAKVEQSLLMLGSVIHSQPFTALTASSEDDKIENRK
jgi:hypothetical protein